MGHSLGLGGLRCDARWGLDEVRWVVRQVVR